MQGQPKQGAETLDLRITEASAKTVASVLAWLSANDNQTVAGQEINANHLRPVMLGARLTAEAAPFHCGRSSVVAHILIQDERQRRICAPRCTIAIRDKD